MLRITSRYVLREVVPPFCLTQVVFTFLLMLDPISKRAEDLIGVGVGGRDVAGILVTLLPYAVGVTLPMALLIGVLTGLGRLSGDREIVAMQACGIGVHRVLAPLLLLAAAVAAVDCYVLTTIVPNANQRFREIVFRVSANRAEGEVRPRVFEVDRFPRAVLYVRESAADGWRDVFLADLDQPGQPDVYVAAWGRFAVDSERRTVSVALRDGRRHRVDPADPGAYEVHDFEALTIQLDASALFPAGGPARGFNELSVPELREEIAAMREAGVSPHQPIMAVHEKFSIPAACFVFVLLAVGLGVSSRKEGRLASFALGIAVILAYYVMMYLGTALAKGQWLSPHLVRWVPNVVLGLAGVVLVRWRSRTIERASRRRGPRAPRPAEPAAPARSGDPRPAAAVSPAAAWGVGLLDRYVTKIYLRWTALAFVGLLGLSYVVTFLDLADKLFKEETTLPMLLTYFWYATPQYVSYALPIAGLVATLVTIGLLTRTSELTVMKACGISLYRMALPILGFSLLWSALLFALGEGVLAQANRRAESLNQEIRTGRTQPIGSAADRAWLVNEDGDIYHYRRFDAERGEVEGLSVYEFAGRPWSLARRTHAAHAAFEEGAWRGRDVWSRDFASAGGEVPAREHDAERALPAVAPPEVFTSELPEAELMNYRELREHVFDLRTLGFDVVALVVDLHRKVSFPFVTFVLTLIAVPFAVTVGPRGALYGVGAGIVLGFTYWIVLSVFGALGAAGVLLPATAAWAPNLIFGASAGYFLFSVRT